MVRAVFEASSRVRSHVFSVPGSSALIHHACVSNNRIPMSLVTCPSCGKAGAVGVTGSAVSGVCPSTDPTVPARGEPRHPSTNFQFARQTKLQNTQPEITDSRTSNNHVCTDTPPTMHCVLRTTNSVLCALCCESCTICTMHSVCRRAKTNACNPWLFACCTRSFICRRLGVRVCPSMCTRSGGHSFLARRFTHQRSPPAAV